MKYEKQSFDHLWKTLYDHEREQKFIRNELIKLYKEMNNIYEALREMKDMQKSLEAGFKNVQRLVQESYQRDIERGED